MNCYKNVTLAVIEIATLVDLTGQPFRVFPGETIDLESGLWLADRVARAGARIRRLVSLGELEVVTKTTKATKKRTTRKKKTKDQEDTEASPETPVFPTEPEE